MLASGQGLVCKVHTQVHSPFPSIPVPGRRFSHMCLDLVGPLPLSQCFSNILTMIDRTFRWLEAVPLFSMTAESCSREFIAAWVSRFGVPALLTSDRGSQFMSSIWLKVCSVLCFPLIQTTSFHSNSNGIIKRLHRSLKFALRAPLVMPGLRSAPKDHFGFFPAEAVFVSSLTLSGKYLEHPEFPPEVFLWKVEKAVSGFSGPSRHHISSSLPSEPLPKALITAKFMFIHDDIS